MIGVATAIAEFRIKEYWINVYLDRNGLVAYGMNWESRDKAARSTTFAKLIYRIHVRLK